MKIQALYGTIPTIKYVGTAGERISKMLLGMKKKLDQDGHSFRPDFQIGEIVIIDRAVDLISPLITQLTYEGLIDEFYGINNSLC
jgi:vacuolar protein sorting-associated protein 33A